MMVSILTALWAITLNAPADNTIIFDAGAPRPESSVSTRVFLPMALGTISPGNATQLRISQVKGPGAKVVAGPNCPDGCIPMTWTPCVSLVDLPDGRYEFSADVYVMATHLLVSTTLLYLVIDRTAPVTAVTLSPAKVGYNATDTNVALQATAKDASPPIAWSLSGNGMANEAGTAGVSPVTVSRSINMSVLAEGTYSIQFGAMDGVSPFSQGGCDPGPPNQSTTSLDFKVDRTPPVVQVPTGTRFFRNPATLDWTVSNVPPTTDLKQTMVYVDGVLTNTFSAGPRSIQYTLDNGAHTYRVVYRDYAENSGSSSDSSFVVDTVAPAASITYPPAEGAISRSQNMTINITDNLTYSLAKMEILVDGFIARTVAPCNLGKWTGALGRVLTGWHYVTVRVTDQAGNVSTSPKVHINILP